MTPDQAEALATRIAQTPGWRTTPDQWIPHLQELDPRSAQAAYLRLASNNQHCPTIAEFRVAYRNHTDRPATEPAHPCSRCDSTGWLHATFTNPDSPFATHTYTGVKPCNCPNGTRNLPTYHATIRPA